MFWFVGGTLKGNVAWLYGVDVIPCEARGDVCVIASGISRISYGKPNNPSLCTYSGCDTYTLFSITL